MHEQRAFALHDAGLALVRMHGLAANDVELERLASDRPFTDVAANRLHGPLRVCAPSCRARSLRGASVGTDRQRAAQGVTG